MLFRSGLRAEKKGRSYDRNQCQGFVAPRLLRPGRHRRAVFEGDTVSGSLMAGQVAGMLHEVRPVADILADLWQGGRQRIAALNTEC